MPQGILKHAVLDHPEIKTAPTADELGPIVDAKVQQMRNSGELIAGKDSFSAAVLNLTTQANKCGLSVAIKLRAAR